MRSAGSLTTGGSSIKHTTNRQSQITNRKSTDVPIDRDAALKTAERLLRQGKLDGAIEQYVRLVEEQPRDWNSINTLGDLYVRAGNSERAVTQYARVADHLFEEGFLPKAAALYKKVLKVRSDHEHTLLRLSDIAARQGLLADAKQYLRQLAQQRKSRGDHKGVADCILRMAAVDENDGDAKLVAARTAEEMGDSALAVTLFQDAAAAYDKQKRAADAVDARVAAASLAPDDDRLRAEVARALIASGQVERAQPFLSGNGAGHDVDLLLAFGRNDLVAGRVVEALPTLMRAVALAPERRNEVRALSDELLAAGRVDDAFACLEILVDAALFEAAFEDAAGILEEFLDRHRLVPALLKLVDVYVDAGFDNRITAVQGYLADAYLETGLAAEARVIAEDLVAREPGVERHAERLRRALELLGVESPEEVIASLRNAEPLFDNTFSFPEASETMVPADSEIESGVDAAAASDISNGMTTSDVNESSGRMPYVVPEPALDIQELLAASERLERASALPGEEINTKRPAPPSGPGAAVSSEVDLSSVLAGLHAPGSTAPRPPSENAEPRSGEASVPRRADPAEQIAEAAALLDVAQEHLRKGLAAEAAAALQAAARIPKFRFKAAAQLGRLEAARGDLRTAVEWFERAAEAATPSGEESFAVLYDLADTLERSGESARALAVFIELEADAGLYRDVHTRIEQLTRGTPVSSRTFHGEQR